jgi:hypothetical protein
MRIAHGMHAGDMRYRQIEQRESGEAEGEKCQQDTFFSSHCLPQKAQL